MQSSTNTIITNSDKSIKPWKTEEEIHNLELKTKSDENKNDLETKSVELLFAPPGWRYKTIQLLYMDTL